MKSKVVLTGIKPTSEPHVGNFIGAIRPGMELAKEFGTSLLFIADYHALTTIQDATTLRQYTHSVAASWIACGLDPNKTVIYRQSDVPEIFELTWILSCVAPKGLLNRAHAYKAAVQENQEAGREDLDSGVSMGLFTYPVLMSADILLFDTDVVPVGEDQVQHVEIARDIAQKFNRAFGETLKLPTFKLQAQKLLPGLDGRKMSKSYGNHIPLFLEDKKLRKLVMRIKTDSTPPEAPKETKGSIIFDIYKEFATPDELSAFAQRYEQGISWGEAKEVLYQKLVDYFAEGKKTYDNLMQNPEEVDRILNQGADRARAMAQKTMARVRAAIK